MSILDDMFILFFLFSFFSSSSNVPYVRICKVLWPILLITNLTFFRLAQHLFCTGPAVNETSRLEDREFW